MAIVAGLALVLSDLIVPSHGRVVLLFQPAGMFYSLFFFFYIFIYLLLFGLLHSLFNVVGRGDRSWSTKNG